MLLKQIKGAARQRYGERDVIACCERTFKLICSSQQSGGSRGRPWRAPPTAQNFLNFMQFFWKMCMLHTLHRVGVISYGESWIRPFNIKNS